LGKLRHAQAATSLCDLIEPTRGAQAEPRIVSGLSVSEPYMNDTQKEVDALEKFGVWLKRAQELRDSMLQQWKPSEVGSSSPRP
jgi:hypothetical protein